MKVLRLKFGDAGIKTIKVFRMETLDRSLIDTEYTNINGMLRWRPPETGTYSFICETHPNLSLTGILVVAEGGYAEIPNMPLPPPV